MLQYWLSGLMQSGGKAVDQSWGLWEYKDGVAGELGIWVRAGRRGGGEGRAAKWLEGAYAIFRPRMRSSQAVYGSAP